MPSCSSLGAIGCSVHAPDLGGKHGLGISDAVEGQFRLCRRNSLQTYLGYDRAHVGGGVDEVPCGIHFVLGGVGRNTSITPSK